MPDFQKLLISLTEFNTVSVILRLVLSVIIGGFIGYERGKHGSAAGLRTHVLVCLGAAMTALSSLYINSVYGNAGDVFRIPAQVISGIGFLGAGLIMVKNKSIITGLTTAAGIWATGAIGIALGYGFYVGAIAAAVICVFTTTVLKHIEKNKKDSANIYAEITADNNTAFTISKIKSVIENTDYTIDISAPRSNLSGCLGLYINIVGKFNGADLNKQLSDILGVNFVIVE